MKIAFPSSVAPSDLELKDTLKLVIASKIANKKFTPSTDVHLAPGGRLPCVLLDSFPVFDVNAAMNMDLKTRSLVNFWFEWESASFDLAVLEQLLKSSKAGLDFPVVQALLFSSALYSGKSLPAYPTVDAWIKKLSAEYSTAIAEATQIVTVKDSVKVKEGISVHVVKKVPVVPVKGQKNILITSALPYVNNVPHLGNIIGCVLSADVYARFCRLRGYNTLYICGTDEYGTATETKALEEGLSCQEICDKYHKIHAEVYKWFNVDFDYFGRTSTPLHTTISQEIFLKLNSKSLLEKKSTEQLYSVALKKFLADRFVEGTCPFCGYHDARGDQCDACGKTYDAIQLINPKCKGSGTTPIIKSSEQMFLKLPELQAKCEEFVKEASVKGFWSPNGIGITNGWFKMGLEPRCITRDLKWGTPVPLDDMKDKVFYVWFDAPIGYLSITANYTADWEKWWKNPEDVQLFQFMGKDNVPFHTVVFPCSLLGTGDKYTMLHHLSTTEYLNYEGDKFSKSRGVGVFGNNVMESGIPPSVWRYYLLSNRPESNDSMFTWSDLAVRNNSELVANLGNFISRTLKFLKAKFNSTIPAAVLNDADKKTIENIDKLLVEYVSSMESVKIRNSLKLIMDLSAEGNLYLQENKLDNTLFESDPKRCGTVMNVATNIIYLISALIYPFMPDTTDDILKQVNAPLRNIPDRFGLDILEGHRIGNPDHLFKRIEEKVANNLFMKYGGEKILEKRKKAEEEKKTEKNSAKPKVKN